MEILELENTISKMKILLNGFTIRLDTTEENTSELEDIAMETRQIKTHREKKADKKMNGEPLETLVTCGTK